MEIYRDIGMAWLETVWSNKIKRRNMERSKKKRKEKEEIKFLVHFFFFPSNIILSLNSLNFA